MELAIAARRALEVLEGRGISVERVYLGTFLSALEMAGLSLSLLVALPSRHESLSQASAGIDRFPARPDPRDIPRGVVTCWPHHGAPARPRR